VVAQSGRARRCCRPIQPRRLPHEGEGVAVDDVEAYKWFSVASAQGNDAAQNGKATVAERMTPQQILQASQRAWEFKPRKTSESGAVPSPR